MFDKFPNHYWFLRVLSSILFIIFMSMVVRREWATTLKWKFVEAEAFDNEANNDDFAIFLPVYSLGLDCSIEKRLEPGKGFNHLPISITRLFAYTLGHLSLPILLFFHQRVRPCKQRPFHINGRMSSAVWIEAGPKFAKKDWRVKRFLLCKVESLRLGIMSSREPTF